GVERVRKFTTEDGLSTAGLRVACRDRNGALWFGGNQGLVRIEPQRDSPSAPNVLVYGIRVNGERRPISDLGDVEPPVLALSSSERQLQLDFRRYRHHLHYSSLLSCLTRSHPPSH